MFFVFDEKNEGKIFLLRVGHYHTLIDEVKKVLTDKIIHSKLKALVINF
jgi:hypothetical protein